MLAAALAGSVSAVSFLTAVLSGLCRIVQHYTAASTAEPRGGLSPGLLLDLASYLLGLLLVSSARLSARSSGGGVAAVGSALDDSLLLFSAEAVSRICCALSADDEAVLYASLMPLLHDGDSSALMAAHTSAAARLMRGDTDCVAVPTRGETVSQHSAPASLLEAGAGSTVPLRQLLCVVCPALSCYRPASAAATAVEQPWLVQRIVDFLAAPGAEGDVHDSSRAAVVHLAACLCNKLPADSPLLASLLHALLEQYALDTLERSLRPLTTADSEQQQVEGGGVAQRLAVAVCLLKALSLRSHPTARPLLLRYAQLPSRVSDAEAGGAVSALLQRWSDGFALLVSDFPLLLTRASHARTLGAATLFRQRLLNQLLPPLQRQIQSRQQQRRDRAQQQLQQQHTPSTLAATATAATFDTDACLSSLLLAAMQLAAHVPVHVAAQCMDALLPLTVLSLSSTDSACQAAGLRTLHSFLQSPPPQQPASKAPASAPLSQASAHLSSILPVLLRLLTRGVDDAPRVADELRALDCLSALRALPFSQLYPFRSRLLAVLGECADREERAIRRQAIRVRNEWSTND